MSAKSDMVLTITGVTVNAFFCLNKTSIPDEEKNMKRFFYKRFQVGHFLGGFAEKNVD